MRILISRVCLLADLLYSIGIHEVHMIHIYVEFPVEHMLVVPSQTLFIRMYFDVLVLDIW
jgi:hypothetical protein